MNQLALALDSAGFKSTDQIAQERRMLKAKRDHAIQAALRLRDQRGRFRSRAAVRADQERAAELSRSLRDC